MTLSRVCICMMVMREDKRDGHIVIRMTKNKAPLGGKKLDQIYKELCRP